MLRKEFVEMLSEALHSVTYLAVDGEWHFSCVNENGQKLQIYLTKNCVNAIKNVPTIAGYLKQICSLAPGHYLLDEENGGLSIKNYFIQS